MHPKPEPTPPRGVDNDIERPDELGPLRWSIRRAIELLDEGIDRMGEQLTRSAGLWGDSPTEPEASTDQHKAPRHARRDAADGHGPPMDHEVYNEPGGPTLP